MDDSAEDLAKGLAKEFYALVTRVAVLERTISERERALVMQAAEYQRRLDELNHSHAQQLQRNSDFIGREVWEAHRNAIETRFVGMDISLRTRSDGLDKRINEFDNWRSRMMGIIVGIAAGAGLIGGGLVSFFARLFK